MQGGINGLPWKAFQLSKLQNLSCFTGAVSLNIPQVPPFPADETLGKPKCPTPIFFPLEELPKSFVGWHTGCTCELQGLLDPFSSPAWAPCCQHPARAGKGRMDSLTRASRLPVSCRKINTAVN